ncbi:MAG TPA: DNA internalization-related competence protein ComEC/Rec2 [Gemmatimonadaceae bacterium]|nr:DNA internalization-related competence protein ComEC/Rec2 [Gemmatimonadaceae bacterium]
MPLVTAAALAYAAGLGAGFGGLSLGIAAALAGAAAAAALRARRGEVAALALVSFCGVAVARAADSRAARCVVLATADRSWRVDLDDDASPGGYARGTLRRADGCALHAALFVGSGRAAAGDVAEVRGALLPADRDGVIVREAHVRGGGERRLLPALRARASRSIGRSFGADSALALALLVADTRSLSPELRDRFAAAGLVHVLSISGLHVAVIAATLLLVFQAARLPRNAAAVAAVGTTAFYVAMIGAPAPAVRAGAMLAAAAASRALQRPTSPWASLALGAWLPMLFDPRAVLDLGFQLSVAGMASLVASGALARRTFGAARGGAAGSAPVTGWRATLARELLASSLATVVTAPLVAWTFGRLSLAAPLTNLAAAPIVGVLQPTLFLGLVVEPLSPALARIVASAAHPMLGALDAVASLGASLPGASLVVAPTLAECALWGAAAASLVVACVSRLPARALLASAGAAAGAVWVPTGVAGGTGSSGEVELHMLDVGQGDALALRTDRGRWVLFDAGRVWTGGDAGRSTVVPYVRRRGGEVAAFVLSHPHADHVGGAASVLRALRPAGYWDAAFAAGSDVYRASLEEAAERGVPWRRVHPGDSLVVDGVVITFLAPDSAWTASLTDPNLASTVAAARFGAVRFLLVGDAESPEEAWLLAHAPEGSLRADVLKVGHHGSRTSSSAPFLDAVRPRVALVSVGAANMYGHPSADVMRELASRGVEVLRTDRLGPVVVRTDGRDITISAGGATWTSGSAVRAAAGTSATGRASGGDDADSARSSPP